MVRSRVVLSRRTDEGSADDDIVRRVEPPTALMLSCANNMEPLEHHSQLPAVNRAIPRKFR